MSAAVPPPPDPNDPIQVKILGIFLFATWLISAVGLYFLARPFYEPEDASPFVMYAKALSFIFITFTFVMTFVVAKKSATRKWLKASLACGIAAIIFISAFFALHEFWTIAYYLEVRGARTVVGSTFLNESDKGKTESEALEYHGGKEERTWPRTQLIQRRLVLAGCYAIAFATFSSFVICMAQSQRLAQKRR